MNIRDPRTGTKLPEPVSQEVFEIVMDTQEWVRRASRSACWSDCSAALLLGSDADIKHAYAGAVAEALEVDVHRVTVSHCLGRADAMCSTFADVASRGGVILFEGLDRLFDGRHEDLRQDVVEMLASLTTGGKPFVVVGTAHSGPEEDAEFASCFGRVGVLSHRGLAKVQVAPARSLAMA